MTIAVIGSLLVMAGVMLGFATQVVPGRLPGTGLVARVLVAGGLFCGVILIAASGAPSRGSERRQVAPEDGSEEWIRALRPGPRDGRG